MTWWTDLMLDMYKTTGLLVLEEDIRDLMRSVQKGQLCTKQPVDIPSSISKAYTREDIVIFITQEVSIIWIPEMGQKPKEPPHGMQQNGHSYTVFTAKVLKKNP